MVEGGSSIITALLATLASTADATASESSKADSKLVTTPKCLVDQLVVTIAPTLVGGLRAVHSPLASGGSAFPRLAAVSYATFGEDIVCRGDVQNAVSVPVEKS